MGLAGVRQPCPPHSQVRAGERFSRVEVFSSTGLAAFSSFATTLALVFSIKHCDSAFKSFKHVRVGFIARVKNYLFKRVRADLLVHFLKNAFPCASRQT